MLYLFGQKNDSNLSPAAKTMAPAGIVVFCGLINDEFAGPKFVSARLSEHIHCLLQRLFFSLIICI